nr:hypothetical protein [Lachnospiraceae bacterium]
LFGFIIRNPFAVPVFALLLYFSFGQGGQSDIGQMFFRIRSADGKLYNGRKQIPPRYSEGMLIMYYMSIGLFMYSAVNVVLWFLFNYNYYIRFLVSGALIAAVLVLGGGGKKQVAGMVSSIIFIVGGFSLFFAVTVFADDNGWSESGRNLKGLIHNNGFPKAAWSSFLPGLFWSLGILFGWPLDLPFLPFDSGLMPPPVPPAPPVNPYDFEGRPQGWGLNDEGDVSFTDPVTGKHVKYGLTGYDENGKGIYISEKGDYYGEDELINNYNNALDHQEYFQDAYKTQQKNVAEQQEMNHAQWEKERQTGETEMSKLVKEDMAKREAEEKRLEQEKKHEEYVKKLEKKYGTTDHKEIKKKIVEEKTKAGIEYENQMSNEAIYREMEKYAEKVEKAADIAIDVLGEISGPAGKKLKSAYKFIKPGLKNVNEAVVNGKDALDTFQALSQGLTEGAFNYLQDHTEGMTNFLTSVGTDTIKAGLDAYCSGDNVGDAMLKSFTQSAYNNAAGAAFDYLGGKAVNFANAKLTAKSTKEIGGFIHHQGKGGLGFNYHMGNDLKTTKYLQKYNNQMVKMANTRLTKIKNIEKTTGAAKDLLKAAYQDRTSKSGGRLGDAAVELKHTYTNNLYNTGQEIGKQIRKNTGYRKKF